MPKTRAAASELAALRDGSSAAEPIPKLRSGGFLSSILEPRRRVDQALYAAIMGAYIGGVSTRKVDALVAALGFRICQDIDQQVQACLPEPAIAGGWLCLRRAEQSDPSAAAGLRLAAMPRPLRSQPAAACAQGPLGHGHGRAAQRALGRETPAGLAGLKAPMGSRLRTAVAGWSSRHQHGEICQSAVLLNPFCPLFGPFNVAKVLALKATVLLLLTLLIKARVQIVAG